MGSWLNRCHTTRAETDSKLLKTPTGTSGPVGLDSRQKTAGRIGWVQLSQPTLCPFPAS